jgi:heme exporter protein C
MAAAPKTRTEPRRRTGRVALFDGAGGNLLALLAVVGPIALLAFALTTAPIQGLSPHASRILYFHVPIAIDTYGLFALTLVASACYLGTRNDGWDRLAHATAEVGVVFALVVVGTGLAWAQVDFAAYQPLQDPKLASVIALAAVYGGYLILRARVTEAERRASLAAVFGIVAFLAVPVAYLATDFGSLHPQPSSVDAIGGSLALAFVLLLPLVVYLVCARVRLLALEGALGLQS